MTEKEQQSIFERWLKEHKGILFKVVQSFSRHPEDQEDLFQVIVHKIWCSVPKFKRASSEVTWIYRISFYAAIAWIQSEKKHRSGRNSLEEMEAFLIPERSAQNRQLDWVFEKIAQFDEADRSLVILLLEGYRYREAAEILGISESLVGVKFNRIKQRLTKMFREEDGNNEI